MIVTDEVFDNNCIEYDVERIAAPSDILFLDIETTGLTPGNSYIYMIGLVYFKNNAWNYQNRNCLWSLKEERRCQRHII